MTTGCATYRHNVANDFRDTIKLNVGVGFGLHVQAKVTSLMDAGLGWGGYWMNAGIENRYTPFLHPSITGCPFPIGVIPGAIPDESPLTSLRMANVRLTTRSDMTNADYAVAGQLFDAAAVAKWDAYGTDKRSPHQVFNKKEQTFTEQPCGIEASVGLLVVNARVGFDPVEFCDLICTLCGWDLLKDNITANKGLVRIGDPRTSRQSAQP
jgi:hypothetical protein